jgi:hypothetical protein
MLTSSSRIRLSDYSVGFDKAAQISRRPNEQF